MKIFNEEDILNEEYRQEVIAEIEGDENIKRKKAMKKRYEVYKDNTKMYVLEMMKAESNDKQITEEIMHRVANVSFARKIIDKKAMVYKDGVKRDILSKSKNNQKQIDAIVDHTNFNSLMKKINRYVELFKNALGSVLPYKCPKTGKYYYRPTVMMPFLYDVIEDFHNPEIPRVIITSYYSNNTSSYAYTPENQSGMRELDGAPVVPFRAGDGIDQIIADSPSDENIDKKEYIWWSNLYHFTTNQKGEIIQGKQEPDLVNPIGELPYHNFSKDQDGHFWAVGGEDIIDGSILLNMLMSDLFYIAKYQGMGIGYMFGKGVPKNAKVGASSFITMEVEEGDPTPQLGFASSNPPIQAHLDMIESYVAYLLSTNKLEAGTVQASLSAASATSGVHEMIKRAENMDDIQDQREIYRDGEPVMFRLMAKWHNLYLESDQLKDELAELGKIDEDLKVGTKFPDPQPFVTEKEKLEIIQKRLDIGIDSMRDSIIKDNPDLSEKDADDKLLRILEEKLKDSSAKMKLFVNEKKEINNGLQEEKEEDEKEEDENKEVKA